MFLAKVTKGEHSFHLFFFGLHSPCVKKMMANNERFMAREVRPETLCYLDSEKEEELLELKTNFEFNFHFQIVCEFCG